MLAATSRRNSVRHLDQSVRRDHPLLRIGADRPGIGNPVADLERGHPLANRLDHTGTFIAGHQRQAIGGRIKPGAKIDIDEIEPDRLLPDQHLRPDPANQFMVAPFKNFGSAMGGNNDRLHTFKPFFEITVFLDQTDDRRPRFGNICMIPPMTNR
jgi:hypothetical protein